MIVRIYLENDLIKLCCQDINFNQDEHNSVVIDKRSNTIKALGENEDKIREILKTDSNLYSQKLLSIDGFNSDIVLDAIRIFYRYIISKNKGFFGVFKMVFNYYEINFDYAEYEKLEDNHKIAFEKRIRWILPVKSFLINGRSIQTKLSISQTLLSCAGIRKY